nr:hypothetical protein HAGR004_40050 [Bdellovibrio sp. HAGR004]
MLMWKGIFFLSIVCVEGKRRVSNYLTYKSLKIAICFHVHLAPLGFLIKILNNLLIAQDVDGVRM